MATCKKQDEKKNAYNTSYGLVLIERIGDDGCVYFDGADHLVRDLCIRHSFTRCAKPQSKVKQVESSANEEVAEQPKPKPKVKRKPRKARKAAE